LQQPDFMTPHDLEIGVILRVAALSSFDDNVLRRFCVNRREDGWLSETARVNTKRVA
jgi:hypothetical protein